MSDVQTSKEITIAGVNFTVTTPFAEGHTCTEAEAKALNQTRCENIRNNMAKRVKDVQDDAGELGAEDLTALIETISTYDTNYVFTLANVGGGRTVLDPVEKEANKIARELIVEALKEAKRKVSDVDKEKLAEAVARKAQEDAIIKLAKKRVEDRKKNAANVLEDLDLLGESDLSDDA